MPTGVAITSLLVNSEDEVYNINILVADNVTQQDKELLESIVVSSESTINFKNSGTAFDNVYEVRGITKATYFRLLIPWLFPEYDKIIYCDGDIIFRKGLKNLYNEDINDYYVGGVLDIYDYKPFIDYISDIGLSWKYYINAGVLLINSQQWRLDKLDQKIITHLDKKYEYQDQDILNIVCQNKIKYLSLIYNFNPCYDYSLLQGIIDRSERYNMSMNTMLKNLHIIHYCGDKPWNSMQQFFSADWWANYAKSVFYNPMMECNEYFEMVYPKIKRRKLLDRFKWIIKKKIYSNNPQ